MVLMVNQPRTGLDPSALEEAITLQRVIEMEQGEKKGGEEGDIGARGAGRGKLGDLQRWKEKDEGLKKGLEM